MLSVNDRVKMIAHDHAEVDYGAIGKVIGITAHPKVYHVHWLRGRVEANAHIPNCWYAAECELEKIATQSQHTTPA